MWSRLNVFLIGMALCHLAVAQAPTTSTTERPLILEPYLQAVTPDAATILWRTAEPAYGWVEYGETPELGRRQDWVTDGLRNANTGAHRARLTGLEPGREYFYRVAWKEIVEFGAYKVVFAEPRFSEIQKFTLPQPGDRPLTVLFLNDLHNNYETFAAIGKRPEAGEAEAVFLNGDCFNDPAGEAEVLKALQVYNAGLKAAQRPVYYVRGNHEARGAYARQLKDYFDYPEGENFFAVTLGPVRFVVLDCGEDKPDDHPEYSGLTDFTEYRERQAEWLRKETGSPEFQKAKYRVLVHHIPLYGEDYSPACQSLWAPILKDAAIDLAVSGHVHKWKITRAGAGENPYPQVVGGGPKPQQATMILLKADNESCGVRILDIHGETLDSISIPGSKR